MQHTPQFGNSTLNAPTATQHQIAQQMQIAQQQQQQHPGQQNAATPQQPQPQPQQQQQQQQQQQRPQQQPDSYFADARKGEVNELRVLLRGFAVEKDSRRQREIVKKVIAYMTLGIDVSPLFTSMMLAVETRDIVIKKMVYLYLCNYARGNPELAEMCTNSLQKDCSHEDPMVRGLALRSLCSLRLKGMVEYISEPLRKSLQDNHPYVRKTGIMGILKIYHLDKSVTGANGENFKDMLYEMLKDPDVNVVSNCIVVLNEVMQEQGGMVVNRAVMHHLLNRLRGFPEFGLCEVLNLLNKYKPADHNEVFQIMNLLDPVLRTSNSGAVLATIKCFLHLTESAPQLQKQVYLRIKPPILTLIASGIPEAVYTLLKHVDYLVQKCPGVFDDEYRQLYVRYNEPTHIKYLKVEILSKLSNNNNAPDIVSELGEYVNDLDSNLARLAIRAMARIACSSKGYADDGKLESQAESIAGYIVSKLVELCELDNYHVSSQAAISLKDIMRVHPSKSDLVCSILPSALKFIADSEGKASVIWMIGEFGESINEAPYVIEKLINDYDNLKDVAVKNALLTATMKLFFKRPPECQAMLGRLLAAATNDVSSQDLHDRALMYHRILQTSPQIAEGVVCGSSSRVPLGTAFTEEDDSGTLVAIGKEFNTLSICYGQTSDNFINDIYRVKENNIDDFSGVAESQEQPQPALGQPVAPAPAPSTTPPVNASQGDLLDMGDPTPPPQTISTINTPSLQLNPNVTLDGQTFQQLWGKLPVLATISSTPLKTLHDTSTFEILFASENILTMASGAMADSLKFFLYGKEQGSEHLFLIEALINKSPPSLNATVKTDAPSGGESKAQQIMTLMTSCLNA